jgi:phosphate transport system substrate-binding protein
LSLPPVDIVVAHRADGSGTTYIWVDYLAKVSPEWKARVGVGPAVNWPVGVGGRGSEGVTGLVSQVPGSIGYVELIYALQSGAPFGSVQNAAGEFVKASVESVTAAAAVSPDEVPADFRVSITNARGSGVYPISSFTWLLLYEDARDKVQARAMVEFVRWALTEGQTYCASLGYGRLPEALVQRELTALAAVKTS